MKKARIQLVVSFSCMCILLVAFLALIGSDQPSLKGKLFIHGGGAESLTEFAKLFPDKTKPIVVIPTAGEGDDFGRSWGGLRAFHSVGFKNVTVLHTRDPHMANQDEFVEPLRKAAGVYIAGGRQWKLADAYLGTKVQKELTALLNRGGIIGGSSAGATIQGSFLVRGDTASNTIMIGDHTEGFGFLKNVAIDQHLFAKNRESDMLEVIRKYPKLLGIGIDEATAIVVSGNTFEVVGTGKVAIYDRNTMDNTNEFSLLSAGDQYDLNTRKADLKTTQPPDQVQADELVIVFPQKSSKSTVYRINVFIKQAKLFEAAHTGVKIRFEFLPADDYPDSLRKLMEDNQPMDLVFEPYDSELSQQGVFVDLLPLFKGDNMSTDDLYKPLVDMVTVNGKLTGIPMTPDPMVVVYNKTWFRKARLPEPTEDWTWEQFFDISARLKEANSVKGKEIYGSVLPMDQSLVEALVYGSGKGLLSPDGSTFSGYLDSPTVAEAVAGVVRGVTTGNAVKQTPSAYNDVLKELGTGNAGMGVTRSTIYSFIEKPWRTGNVGVVPVPRTEKGSRANPTPISTLSIAAASEHQTLAWTFMKEVILDPGSGFQQDWAKQEMLTSKGAVQRLKLTEDPGMKVMYEELKHAVSPVQYRNPKLRTVNLTSTLIPLPTADSPAAIQKLLTEAALNLDQRLAQTP